MDQVRTPLGALSRLGLSHAALKAAILAELDQDGVGQSQADSISEAVADAIEANNEELLRQLRTLLFSD